MVISCSIAVVKTPTAQKTICFAKMWLMLHVAMRPLLTTYDALGVAIGC